MWYYALIVVIFVGFKLSFTRADANAVLFLLKPLDALVGFAVGEKSVYMAVSGGEMGFLYENLNIVIDKSCSGFNFWLICFLLISVRAGKVPFASKIATLGVSLAAAYFATLFVNLSRILFTLFFNSTKIGRMMNDAFPRLHQAEGAFVYLFFLIIIYALTCAICNRRNQL